MKICSSCCEECGGEMIEDEEVYYRIVEVWLFLVNVEGLFKYCLLEFEDMLFLFLGMWFKWGDRYVDL